MVRGGALQLSDYPTAVVRLACTRCDRRGQYRKATLTGRYGPDVNLPDLLAMIAECPRHGKMHDACGAYFADLSAGQNP